MFRREAKEDEQQNNKSNGNEKGPQVSLYVDTSAGDPALTHLDELFCCCVIWDIFHSNDSYIHIRQMPLSTILISNLEGFLRAFIELPKRQHICSFLLRNWGFLTKMARWRLRKMDFGTYRNLPESYDESIPIAGTYLYFISIISKSRHPKSFQQ